METNPDISSVEQSSPTPMILVLDLEATCCDRGTISTPDMEIIEIGAVWATISGHVIDTFQTFVRPRFRPVLTKFCQDLTSIRQSDVASAPSFAEAATQLRRFAQSQHVPARVWGSWGKYDFNQIERDCVRNSISSPLADFSHRNLKRDFAKKRKIKEVGVAKALEIAGLQFFGTHHRAIDDAINIAALLPWCATQP
jgi:inhibitor of KinA sporulation pathway (predicted exonuclease)